MFAFTIGIHCEEPKRLNKEMTSNRPQEITALSITCPLLSAKELQCHFPLKSALYRLPP